MVKLSNLEKKFGKVKVLNGLNLSMKESGIVALLGPNGSGKTTLLKCILGMVIPDQGTITINDNNIEGNWEYRKEINYLPQIARFPDNITVNEIFHMIGDIRGDVVRKEELIELFGLESFRNKKLAHLSGGTRQKVNIVLSFMFDNHIMILDEPSAGLDPLSIIKLKELIMKEKERGKLIIFTTHIMSFVEEMADEILFILDGRLHFQGTFTQLKSKTSENNLEKSIATLLTRQDV